MIDDTDEIQQTLRNRVAKMIRQLRGNRSLREMSELVGFSVSYLSDIERGRTIPTLGALEKIAIRSGAALKLEFVFEEVPPEYIMVKRSDLDELLRVAARFNFVYATIDYLMKPEYTPKSIRPEVESEG